jgi:hypothetical protein
MDLNRSNSKLNIYYGKCLYTLESHLRSAKFPVCEVLLNSKQQTYSEQNSYNNSLSVLQYNSLNEGKIIVSLKIQKKETFIEILFLASAIK